MHFNRADKLIDCALFDKTPKLAQRQFNMLHAKLEMETSANGPMATVGATPMSKSGQKLKSSRKTLRTSFLNQNDRY